MTVFAAILALILFNVAAPPPDAVMTAETTSAGNVSAAPDTGIAGEFGAWSVTYEVGDGGIATGGGIRVQLPDAWHAGPRNSANRLQATDAADDHFVLMYSSREDVGFSGVVEDESASTLIKHAKASLDGRLERYVFVVRVVVTNGELRAGDLIHVVYGYKGGGSRGYRAGAVSTGPEPVLVALDAAGDGRFKLHTDRPALTIVPGAPVELQVHAPTNAVAGAPMRLLVSMLDKEDNASHAAENVTLSVVRGAAALPETVTIPKGAGYAEVTVTPAESGVLQIAAQGAKWVLAARSNPTVVSNAPLDQSIYWGDLHSHSKYSWDGVGANHFEHAQYIAGLDFYAMTDHSRTQQDGLPRGLGPEVWKEYTALTERHHAPGQFVTLHAYEASFGSPYGHHNVYFRGEPGPLLAPEAFTLPQFWATLEAGDALTIPHHTGKFPGGVDFSVDDSRFRRNFEIYSAHGLSEAADPDHPLSFERSTFTNPSSTLSGPSHAQDAWRLGLRLSTVAASDDHRAHPGLPHWGLTAVYAPELSRDAIFQALHDRRTYGTTGAKIVLDFSVNDAPMGQIEKAQDVATAYIRAIGTDLISRVELMRHREADDWQVIASWHPDAQEFEASYRDEGAGPALYYVRLRQAAPVRDRIAMAWSSPVWLE